MMGTLACEVDALQGDDDDTQSHEVRKSAKRVRYAAESLDAVFGKRATKLAERMEALQEALGTHQDALVVQAVLVDLADGALAAGEDTFTYGRLHALEQARAAEAGREGRALLAKLGAKPRRGCADRRAREHRRHGHAAGAGRRADRRPPARGDDRGQPGPHRRRAR